MEHVVFFPAMDGAMAFRRVDGLDEAVRFVEHLRNVEGVLEATVHALTDVPLSFRAYYHVEVPVSGADGAPAAAVAAVAEVAEVGQVVEVAAAAEVPVEVPGDVHAETPEAPADVVEDVPVVVEPIAALDPRHLESAPVESLSFDPPTGPAVAAPLLELVPNQPSGPDHAAAAARVAPADAASQGLQAAVPFAEPARSLGFFA